jgi:hypothetical protein
VSFWGRWLPRFTVLLAFFAVAVVFQHLSGAYRADLSGYPDEPGHFVTGVMVSNYLSTPPPAPMVPFAKEFYIHYPKVAIGHWPPVFYLLEGFWFLLFHPSRESVLWLIALISALLSATVYGVVRREYGAWAGVAAGFLLQCVPIVWTQTGQVMTDLLVGLFGFWAALAFASFLQKGRRLSLYGFAILAILAIFTKNNGMYLSLTPVLALALTKRLRLLLSPWLWLSAALVGVPTAVWFAFSRKFVISTWGEAPSLSFFRRALGTNAAFLISIFGIAFSVLICVGLFRKVVQPLLLHAIVNPLWAVLASLAASVYLFQSVMWAGLEPRFIVPAVPALIPFLFAGVEWLARLAAPLRGSMRVRALALLACATVLFACQTFAVPRKPYRGFSEVADVILSRPESGGAAILVSSAYDGEGLLISECVMRQPHPTAFVLRASKVLSRSDWLGRFYEARFPSANDVMRYLDDIPVDFLVIDNVDGFPPLLHQRQLMEMVVQRPDHWRPVGTFPQRYPASNAASRIFVYRRSGAPGNPEKKVRLEMGQILRRIL